MGHAETKPTISIASCKLNLELVACRNILKHVVKSYSNHRCRDFFLEGGWVAACATEVVYDRGKQKLIQP